MKKISLILAAVTVIFLVGCAKDAPQPRPANEATTFTELTVSKDFDWKMTSEVKCDFTATHTSKVALATAANAEPFATFAVGDGIAPMVVSIARSTTSLYVSYETAQGTWKGSTIPVAQTIQYVVPADSRDYSIDQTRAAAKVKGQIVYPNYATWGTLLFEDMWPSYGDYDFNDWVISYRIEENLENNMVTDMLVKLNLNAASGSLPFNFGMELRGPINSEIASITKAYQNKPAEKVTIKQNTSPSDYATLWVYGMCEGTVRPAGSCYLNTEHGYELMPDQLSQFSIKITFTRPIEQELLTQDQFNFFIGSVDNQNRHVEIHMGGQKPTSEAINDYTLIAREHPNTKTSQGFYYSDTNLVWALNVPATIKHAYERESFLDAYPDFATWAQSSGTLKAEWYNNGVADKLVRIR
ncbi:MAG: LruC domain-containing protein [Alistipes sp.]